MVKYISNNSSRLITVLRFPMLAGVVLIHASIVSVFSNQGRANLSFPIASFTENFFSRGICGICVPLFFFISGYLFFLNGEWGIVAYLQKIKKRFYSLFIPYFIYSYVAILVFAVFQEVIPELQSGTHVPIKDWTLWDFIHHGLWRYGNEGIPFVGPLWFLRNLMIIVLCSPLVYWIVRYTRQYGIILIGMSYLANISVYSIPGTLGLFYFTWGGYFSINKKDFTQSLNNCTKFSWLAFPLFLIDAATKNMDWNIYLHNLAVLLGLVLVVNSVSVLIFKHNVQTNTLLLQSTFFVYAAHEPYLDQISKICAKIVPIPESSIMADCFVLLFYAIYWLIIIAFLVLIFVFIRKLSPQLASLLSGGRV